MKRTIYTSLLGLCIFALGHSQAATLSGKLTIKDKKDQPADYCDQAVVFLEPTDKAMSVPTSANMKSEMRATDKVFTPGVLVVEKGATVQFPNDDKILHNVFSLSKTKKFDLGLYRKGDGKSVTFDKPGIVKVYCNIHSKMNGVVLVLENSLFARVKSDCSYSVENVPSGEFKVSAWYRYGKGKEETIKIADNRSLDFSIKHTKKVKRKHKNKHGKSYKENY